MPHRHAQYHSNYHVWHITACYVAAFVCRGKMHVHQLRYVRTQLFAQLITALCQYFQRIGKMPSSNSSLGLVLMMCLRRKQIKKEKERERQRQRMRYKRRYWVAPDKRLRFRLGEYHCLVTEMMVSQPERFYQQFRMFPEEFDRCRARMPTPQYSLCFTIASGKIRLFGRTISCFPSPCPFPWPA